MIEDRTRTDRRAIEDLSKTEREAIESRRHPERIPKENKATQHAKTLTKILLLSKSQGIKLLNSSKSQGIKPVKQPEQQTPIRRTANLLAIYYTDGVIINRHVLSLSTRCTYPLVVNCFHTHTLIFASFRSKRYIPSTF